MHEPHHQTASFKASSADLYQSGRARPGEVEVMSMTKDAEGFGPATSLSGRRVCIVTPDIIGPIRNGGIGTAYTSLAQTLADAGIAVDILYVLGDLTEVGSIDRWIEHYAERNIQLIPLPSDYSYEIEGSLEQKRSFRVLRWLMAHDGSHSVVHFPDWNALAYYTALAKHQGWALQDVELCVGAHSPTYWGLSGGRQLLSRLEDLQVDFMEREAVRLCDVLVSPSRYMVEWLLENGWTLPRRCVVHPNIMLAKEGAAAGPEIRRVDEIVFFGRLEKRKGLDFFLKALSRSPLVRRTDVKFTFLGKEVEDGFRSSREIIEAHSSDWASPVRIISDLDSPSAIAFLREGARLAVMPSLCDNSPYVVLECLVSGIPFLCSRVGGVGELIDSESVDAVLFDLFPGSFLPMLEQAVEQGARVARPSMSNAQVIADWVDWHRRPRPVSGRPKRASHEPLVTVCLTHFNRARLLSQALASLRNQSYQNLEVIVVDCSSSEPEAVALINRLEEELPLRGWSILRMADRYLGAARNLAARHAKGEYLLFMDDDNCAKTHEVETFVRAALHSGADILTSMNSLFKGGGPPVDSDTRYWLPVGPDPASGLYVNTFGDANALVRKATFDALDGFTEIFGVGQEDWEFFSRAVLRGYDVQVVPEALYWYRHGENTMSSTVAKVASTQRIVRPYMGVVRPDLLGALEYAAGSKLFYDEALTRARGENSRLWENKAQLQKEYTAYRLRAEALDAGVS